MIFSETKLKGAFVVDIEPRHDERGLFARSFCAQEFSDHGLESHFVQCNVSRNVKKGTVRGMHFQKAPFEEGKLVRCTHGRIFDVIVDLRPESESRLDWYGIELSDENHRALYIPPGFAHGFQTMEGNSEVFYQMTEFYHEECSTGVRWNDPAIAIEWPFADPIISPRDASYPDIAS